MYDNYQLLSVSNNVSLPELSGGQSTGNIKNLKNEIAAIYQIRKPVSDLIRILKIKNIKKIRCLGIANWSVTANELPYIRDGNIIRILLFLDPKSKFAQKRTAEEGQDVSKHVKSALRQLRDIIGDKNLKIFTYKKIPRYNMIFIDAENDVKHSCVIVQHYSYIRGGGSPQFVIRKYRHKRISSLYAYYENIYYDMVFDAKRITKRSQMRS